MTSHRRPRPWTSDEDAILREHYPGKGYRACLEYLPDHSPSSIENRGRSFGFHGPKGPLSQAGLDARRLKTQARYQKNKNPERAERLCLGVCGRTFISEWKGNRMCESCRKRVGRLGITAGTVMVAI